MQAEAMLSLGSNNHLPDNTGGALFNPAKSLSSNFDLKAASADRIHSDFYRRRLVAAEVSV